MSTSATVCVVILAGFVSLVESTCNNCKDKCCGKYHVCSTSCNGYSCDDNSECGDGCCVVGYCIVGACVTEFSKLHVGLITGGSVFILTTLVSCLYSYLRRHCCRKKKDKEEETVVVNLQTPMENPGNPHPNQPHEMATHGHVPTSPMAPSAMINQGYQIKLQGKTGQIHR